MASREGTDSDGEAPHTLRAAGPEAAQCAPAMPVLPGSQAEQAHRDTAVVQFFYVLRFAFVNANLFVAGLWFFQQHGVPIVDDLLLMPDWLSGFVKLMRSDWIQTKLVQRHHD